LVRIIAATRGTAGGARTLAREFRTSQNPAVPRAIDRSRGARPPP